MFPPEPIVVTLLSAKIDSWVYYNYTFVKRTSISMLQYGEFRWKCVHEKVLIVYGSNEMLKKLSDQCGLLKSSSPAWSL